MDATTFDATATVFGATTTRRAAVLGIGALLAGLLAPRVDAKPVSPKSTIGSVRKRVAFQVQNCEDLGGSATVSVRPGGTAVSCSGGDFNGVSCVNSSKRTRCSQ